MKPRDIAAPIIRWWRGHHPVTPIEHREPPEPRSKAGPVEHGPTKAPFSRAARTASYPRR
jgi:hypothetical protein